jgi:hypothetical protein
MKTLLWLAAIAGVAALLASWTDREVNAQTSLCFQRCTSQYGWPMDQCANYCKRRASQRTVYGYAAKGGAGSCGTYMFWKNGECFDARNK